MSPARDINDCLSVLRSCYTLRYPLSPLRGQQQSNKNKGWMLSTREWFTLLSRSDVSRPTAAFRNIVDAKLLNRASPHRLYRCAPASWLPTRSPRAAPLFRVLRPRFTASSMPSCSTVRLSIAKGFRFTIQAPKY